MSNLLKEKHTFALLRARLKGKRERKYWSCKGFRYLAQNCRKQKEEKKRTVVLQNKFEILRNRIIQCEVKERTIRRIRVVEVECFKYGKKGHKCKECPLWVRKEVVYMARPQKVQQKKRPVCPVKGKVQKRKLRKVEEEKAAVHMAKP